MIRLALVQFDIAWQNVEENIRRIKHLLQNPQLQPFDLLILPETWPTGFSMDPDMHRVWAVAKTFMHELSQIHGASIIGGIPSPTETGQENRSYWISEHGEDYYVKNRAFKFAGEHLAYQEGKEAKTWTINNLSISPLICYDLRFPELARRVAKNSHAMLYIANWPKVREHHWRSLLMARAIENQCYVIAVNRIGIDGNSLEYPGASLVIDPLGNVVLDAADKQGIFHCEINAEHVEKTRKTWPFLEDM